MTHPWDPSPGRRPWPAVLRGELWVVLAFLASGLVLGGVWALAAPHVSGAADPGESRIAMDGLLALLQLGAGLVTAVGLEAEVLEAEALVDGVVRQPAEPLALRLRKWAARVRLEEVVLVGSEGLDLPGIGQRAMLVMLVMVVVVLVVASAYAAALREHGFGGVLAVGAGSAHLPHLVLARYAPPPPDPPLPAPTALDVGGRPARGPRHVVLAGKGVSFDTGGLSIKPRESMVAMKTDMAGAAAFGIDAIFVSGGIHAGEEHLFPSGRQPIATVPGLGTTGQGGA